MRTFQEATARDATGHACRTVVVALLCLGLAGCQAVTNPVLDGVPARRLPLEYLGRSRESLRPLPLSWLRQAPISTYKVAGGDVLGLYLDPIIGPKGGTPPVNPAEAGQLPSVGVPFAVQPDGTLVLPLLKAPLPVKGKTLQEIQTLIHATYQEQGQIQPNQPALVTLVRRRTYHVLVVRQDSGSNAPTGTGSVLGVGAVGQAVGGMTFDEIQRAYDLTLEDIRGALAFAARVVEETHAHRCPWGKPRQVSPAS